jgi:hypothetical protein
MSREWPNRFSDRNQEPFMAPMLCALLLQMSTIPDNYRAVLARMSLTNPLYMESQNAKTKAAVKSATSTPPQLETFFGNLTYRLKLLNDTRTQTDIFLSTRFNVFDFIEPDENRLSEIIARMLDPNERHGQKAGFLNAFLKVICEREGLDSADCKVKREDLTAFIERGRRRIDIRVELRNFAVAIENKPWANEQPEQIGDYVEHLQKCFKENFTIIFLTQDGRKPTSLKEEVLEKLLDKGQLLTVAYPGRFKQWLEACIKECCSDKVRWFLRDFTDFVEHKFPVET